MKPNFEKYLKLILITWIVCSVLFLLAYATLLRPMQEKNRQLAKKAAEKKQIYDLILQTEQEHTKLQLTDKINYSKSKLGRYVVEPGNMADLIFKISQVANEKKAESFSIKNRDSRDMAGSNCKYMSEGYIDMKFESSFKKFASILNSLERNSPIVFIDKFSITRSDVNQSANNVQMNLAVFVKKDNMDMPRIIGRNQKQQN